MMTECPTCGRKGPDSLLETVPWSVTQTCHLCRVAHFGTILRDINGFDFTTEIESAVENGEADTAALIRLASRLTDAAFLSAVHDRHTVDVYHTMRVVRAAMREAAEALSD